MVVVGRCRFVRLSDDVVLSSRQVVVAGVVLVLMLLAAASALAAAVVIHWVLGRVVVGGGLRSRLAGPAVDGGWGIKCWFVGCRAV